MKLRFNEGVWPVMLTPFKEDGSIDYPAVEALVEWYIQKGVAGLFAVCQSSEMFFLSLEERVNLTAFIKDKAAGRIPVISSGHVSYAFEDQITELKAIADAGADAVVLLTNRLAKADESDDVFLKRLEMLLDELPEDLPLGFYECPYPYKRILSEKVIRFCVESERFYFLKDTCCDLDMIRRKLEITKGSKMKLYNANTATLLDSLKAGAAGYSGVMANFHPELYVWLQKNWEKESKKAEFLQGMLTMSSFIELKNYPLSAKAYLKNAGLPMECVTRKNTADSITVTEISELRQLKVISDGLEKILDA